jgi:hypothetical protein
LDLALIMPADGPRGARLVEALREAILSGRLPLDTIATPADKTRRLNAPGEAERRLGHPDMDYTVDLGTSVKAIMIDTVNRDGSSQARINPAQLAWLQRELAGTDRWIVVFSHNPLTPEALQALDANPKVVASIAGNSHKNRITKHNRYWLISTSSLADFPQQARMFRLRATNRGVALETWMIDHDGTGLAGISRELAYLDAQGGRPQHFAGTPADRNTRLYISRP